MLFFYFLIYEKLNFLKVLKENGAKRVFACISHGLLNDPAVERIEKSPIENVSINNNNNI